MKFRRVNADKLSEKTIAQIEGMINKGLLKPGDRLPSERELSLKLGISRGILREALKTLESLGYLTRKPGGGTFIRELTYRNNEQALSDSLKHATYLDYLAAREMLEQKIVELAIEQASDAELEEIENTIHLVEKGEVTSEVVLQFHYKLALTTRNVILSNFMQSNSELHKNFVITVGFEDDEDRKKHILREHKAILEAIKERNREKAVKAVTAHLDNARKYIEKKYKTLAVSVIK
jgi:GntR family transcriptional regulator, transcriptional repressor for pyruvate dehydrogenase complex